MKLKLLPDLEKLIFADMGKVDSPRRRDFQQWILKITSKAEQGHTRVLVSRIQDIF